MLLLTLAAIRYPVDALTFTSRSLQVPYTQPERGLYMISQFIAGKPL